VCSFSTPGGDDFVEVPRSERSALAALRNLFGPGSARWKAQRWLANLATRIRRRSGCCGHPGEPGC
jgi:hypothetical protein